MFQSAAGHATGGIAGCESACSTIYGFSAAVVDASHHPLHALDNVFQSAAGLSTGGIAAVVLLPRGRYERFNPPPVMRPAESRLTACDCQRANPVSIRRRSRDRRNLSYQTAALYPLAFQSAAGHSTGGIDRSAESQPLIHRVSIRRRSLDRRNLVGSHTARRSVISVSIRRRSCDRRNRWLIRRRP